jgi:uncharacterized membrane protein YccC
MVRIKRLIDDLVHLMTRIAHDFGVWPASGPRRIDEIESVLSVLLAIALAHFLGAINVGWAAFSGYMVMRSHVAVSLKRGGLRVIGTAAGAAFSWILAHYIADSPALLSMALASVGLVTLYFALVTEYGYAWLFAGLTFAMVLIDGMEHPHEALEVFAQSRFIEVLAGTFAAVLVSGASAITTRRKLPDPRHESGAQARLRRQPLWHRAACGHAVQGAIALGIIPWLWTWFGIASLSQSSTTIMAVMMVPLASLSNPSHPTTSRILHRFVGCSVGGLLATIILLISHASPIVLVLAVCLGVAAGRHVENGELGIGYIGTQFTLAFLVVLVPDTYSRVHIGPGVERLLGIFFGMVLLEPVRFIFRRCLHWCEGVQADLGSS